MILFKVYYYVFLFLIAVCNRFYDVMGADNLVDDNVPTKDEIIDEIVRMQEFDRGYVANPNIDVDVESLSLEELTSVLQEATVELQCSYVYFALLYLHLIEPYMSDPNSLFFLTMEDINSIKFTKESSMMVALTLTNPDPQLSTIRPVMWLFHVFAKKTASFLESDRSNHPYIETLYRSVIFPYNTINTLLGDFARDTGCEAYDQVTGESDNMNFVEKARSILVGGKQSANSELRIVKTRFREQTAKNRQIGFFASEPQQLLVENLLIGNVLQREEVMIPLEKIFGIQLEWEPIMSMLGYYYYRVSEDTMEGSMQEYIETIQIFQNQFIRVLEAIAMRIVIMHLLQFNHSITEGSSSNLPHQRVANALQAFVDCVLVIGDQHLKTVIDLMNNLSKYFKNPKHIDELVNDILKLLEMMSASNEGFDVRFDAPIPVEEVQERATNATIKYASDNGIDIPEDADDVMVIEVYVEFVKRMTNFEIINSFAELSYTPEYQNFADLETGDTNTVW